MDNIVWKKVIIDGTITNYSVSNQGHVRNDKKGGRLLSTKSVYVVLSGTRYRVNYLVMRAFSDNPEAKEYIIHLNHDITDFRIENLQWATYGESCVHNSKCRAVIDEHTVRRICKLIEDGESAINISKQCNTSISTIKNIRYKHTWTYISQDYNFPDPREYSKYNHNSNKLLISKIRMLRRHIKV